MAALLVRHGALGVLDLRAQHRELRAREGCKRGIIRRLQIALEQVDHRFILGNLRGIEASEKVGPSEVSGSIRLALAGVVLVTRGSVPIAS